MHRCNEGWGAASMVLGRLEAIKCQHGELYICTRGYIFRRDTIKATRGKCDAPGSSFLTHEAIDKFQGRATPLDHCTVTACGSILSVKERRLHP